MKIKFFILLISLGLLTGVSALYAQTEVSVYFIDGTDQSYNMSAEGKLYFSNDYLFLKDSAGITSSIALSQIRKMTFRGDNSGIVSNSETGKMFIYPNPSSTHFRIGNLPDGMVDVSIYSMNGKLLLHTKYQNGDQIEVHNLTQGLYIVKVDEQALKFCKQ